MIEEILDIIDKEEVNLFVNGKEIKNVTRKKAQKKSCHLYGGILNKIDINSIIINNDYLNCLSYWRENGKNIVTYNPAMGSSPVKLQRLKDNVKIQVALAFYGQLATTNFDSQNKTYAQVAFEGIKRTWLSQKLNPDEFNFFGDYDELSVDFEFNLLPSNNPEPHIKIFIKEQGQPICLYNLFWNISGSKKPFLDDITLRAFFKRKLTADEFMLQAAHEFGHILGLGDAYEGAFKLPLYGAFPQNQAPTTFPVIREIPLDEVMRSGWHSAKVYPNTIEMILEAFKINRLQKYDPRDPSKVIRSY